jgi:hypothetical protein
LHQIIPFKILLCQSGRQGANHFRLSGYKSSNTKKLSDFPSHKVVIAARESRPRGELGIRLNWCCGDAAFSLARGPIPIEQP